MQTASGARRPVSLASVDALDERALLAAFDDLLAREEALLASGDVSDLPRLADERERLSVRLFEAATARRSAGRTHDAELIALYQGLRRRHDVRAQVVQRYEAKNARALGVLAQASGHANVYRADGRLASPWGAVA